MKQHSSLKLLACLSFAIPACAQMPPPPLKSPEVNAERKVTFRFRAPNAKSVSVTGDWGFQNAPLTKDEQGIWSGTIGPLAPDFYGYSFKVDDVTVADPSNPLAKPSRAHDTSILDVPGEKPAPSYRVAGVTRGKLHLHEYDSKALGRARRLRVYTPVAYDAEAARRFPVLYLLHGAGDNEATWTELGRAHVILDNLIAGGRTQPMIVVMTDGHAVGGFSFDVWQQNLEGFERDLLEDAIPLVQANYRVAEGRENRAIVGLSMGGLQALTVGLNHRDQFAWVGGMSSALFDPQRQFSKFFEAPNQGQPLRLLWLAIGKQDFLLRGNQQFDKLLSEKNVPHQYTETEGAHAWPVWRRYLAEVAPRLFVP